MPAIRYWIGGVLGVLACAFLGGYIAFTSAGPLSEPTNFVIPKGLGVERIAARLAEGGIIRYPYFFATLARLSGNARKLRAGEFRFPAHVSSLEAMDILIYAKPVIRKFTVPEGFTTPQILDELSHTEGLEGALEQRPAEGSLLPETYNFSYGDSREELTMRMHRAMTELLDTLWKEREPGLPLKTRQEALILASIVEKETGLPEERPHIAAVFLNRLRHNMRLQSDPTVVYALTRGKGPLGRPLGHADLETPSPYNTYLNDGLPPGPIDNPGRASIIAVLHPASSDDLYFVADGSGGHVFAKTLAEHNKNVARLRHFEAEQDPAGKSAPAQQP